MEFPNKDLIKEPMLDLYYEIDINAGPVDIYPWLNQVGYHRQACTSTPGGMNLNKIFLTEL